MKSFFTDTGITLAVVVLIAIIIYLFDTYHAAFYVFTVVAYILLIILIRFVKNFVLGIRTKTSLYIELVVYIGVLLMYFPKW